MAKAEIERKGRPLDLSRLAAAFVGAPRVEIEQSYVVPGEFGPAFAVTADSMTITEHGQFGVRKMTLRPESPDIMRIVRGQAEGELRVRKAGHEHFLTVKGKGDLKRLEWESPLLGSQYRLLAPAEPQILKVRATLVLNGLKFEWDQFRGRLGRLDCIEVEFTELERAHAFTWPDDFGPILDVTNDARFKNANLARAQNADALLE